MICGGSQGRKDRECVQHSSHVKVQGGRSCPAFCFVGDGMNMEQNGELGRAAGGCLAAR